MTQEEKAKAYDEALERFKSFKERYYTRNTHFGDVIFDKNGEMQKDFEEIFPQLRESEDERIRKGIIEIIKAVSGPDCDVYLDEKKQEKYIAWLEKQKEQDWNKKPCLTCQEYEKGHKQGYTEGCTAGYNKAMKEIEQKEQKPAEWTDTNELVFKDICKHLEVEGYGEWVLLLNALRNEEFQPKQEWSEEDEEMLEEIINHIDTTSVQRIPARPGSAIGKSWIKFLKSIRPQPKQEWSEEDEDMLNCCISSIEEAKENRYAYKEMDGDTSYDHEIDWLKSLRPQYHGDVTMTEAYKMGLEAGKASSWKPSEEQMEAFRSYIKDFQEKAEAAVGGWNNFDVMIRLFEQLKKLGAKEEPEYYQHFDPDC